MNFNSKVIYQIYPKSFKDTNNDGIGDLKGIIQKLDYLKDLGVDYLWLCPINKSPQNDNGYDISDYKTIDEMFGTNEDYEELIKKAKEKGLKIMMDLVLNHTSTAHAWFQKALSGDKHYQDYYIFRDEPTDLKSIFGGDAWEYVPSLNKYYLHMFDVTQADLNWENEEMRQELYKMINTWINKGVEGFRLDVIDMIGKNVDTGEISRTPRFYELLAELHEQTFGDRLLTVGECWGADLNDAAKLCSPMGLTQVFHFEDMSLTNYGYNKWHQKPLDIASLARVLMKWNNDYKGINAWVSGNHDSPRTINKWFNNLSYRSECAKLLITMYSFLRGNLYIYQGDEIGMTNYISYLPSDYNDVEAINYYKEQLTEGYDEAKLIEEIALISRDNARMPMQWDGSKNAGFSEANPWLKVNRNYGSINAENDLSSEDSIYKYYQKALRFHKEYEQDIECEMSAQIINKAMILRKDHLVAIFNFAEETVKLEEIKGEVLLTNYEMVSDYLRPYECIIYYN